MLTSNIEFLKYCLEGNDKVPECVKTMEWKELYAFGYKQSIIGILFEGINRLPKDFAPSYEMLMKWLSLSEQIKKYNIVVNNEAVRICELFRNEGLNCCVLKGQGNAILYPNPYSRMPGDIDLWVSASRQITTDVVKKHFRIDDLRFHHVEVTGKNNVLVEVHFFPLYMNNPIYNKRFQRWAVKMANQHSYKYVDLPDGVGHITIPNDLFNLIYQLGHIFHHFFDEGIGLRQLIDYYYLLKKVGYVDKEEISRLLKYLGLYKFARAVMYVEHELLGLPESFLIVAPDVKRGKRLQEEIIDGGNFGRHYSKYGRFTQKNIAYKHFLKIYRNMHFIKEYPAEALSEPLFRTWHFFWRKRNNIK